MSGGRLREYELLKGLSKKYDIYLFVVTNTYPQDKDNIFAVDKYCKEINVFEGVDIKTKNSEYSKYKDQYPDKIIRVISRNAKEYIGSLLATKQIDLIHLESFYMKYYIAEKNNIPIVLAAQNVEFDLLEQEINFFPHLKKDLQKQYSLLKKYEVQAWKFANKCIALTKHDRDIMVKYVPEGKVKAVTNGFDHLNLDPKKAQDDIKVDENTILITGNYQYKPNADAVTHFNKNIFPVIEAQAPDARLMIVGNQPTEEIQRLEQNPKIKVFGNVESLSPYLRKCTLFACPLRIGGGIKVKMLEALAHKCAIVSTSIGAQGIENTKPQGFLEASDDLDFANKVIELIRNKEKRESIQNNTSRVIANLPSWEDSLKSLSSVYESLIN